MKKCRQYERAAKKIKINIGAVQREVAAAANLHPAFLASARKNRCMPRVGEIFKRPKKGSLKNHESAMGHLKHTSSGAT
tara:strand:+ start:170 stop:406 length:237 start_codon:yes stop_codon:yes gene_type:complete